MRDVAQAIVVTLVALVVLVWLISHGTLRDVSTDACRQISPITHNC